MEIVVIIIAMVQPIFVGLIYTIWTMLNKKVDQIVKSVGEITSTIISQREKQIVECEKHRKDIYNRYLTKELFESKEAPLIEKMNDLEKEFKELSDKLWNKIDNMNNDILIVKNTIMELQRMMLENSNKDK